MTRETSIGGGNVRFEDTLWTLVYRAKDADDRRQALEELFRRYWKPVYFYIRRRGHPVEDAKDLAQEFCTVFLEKQLLASVSPEKGRFRNFVLVALKHFLAKEFRRAQALKRGGSALFVPLDAAQTADESANRAFEREWALAVVESAVRQLRLQCENEGKGTEFDALQPFLLRGTRRYEQIAADLGVTADCLARRMFALRTRLKALIRQEIHQTVADEPAFSAELREIRKFL
ncbi:MAG: sigma-70 family RNA polymerase sigma factor [Planctomycetes bacterium]|nr:sigma-70 family RNA polymerase sigma factor [Planctomycetota bacterium]